MLYDKKRVAIIIVMNNGATYTVNNTNTAGSIIDIGTDVTTAAIWTTFTTLLTTYNTAVTGNTTYLPLTVVSGQNDFLRFKNGSVASETGVNGPYTYLKIPTKNISTILLEEIPFNSKITK